MTTTATRHEVQVDTETRDAQAAYVDAYTERDAVSFRITAVRASLDDGTAAHRREGVEGAHAELVRLQDDVMSTSYAVGAAWRRLQDAHDRYTGWARYYYAQAANGHVHSSTDCSTCNRGAEPTDFAWLVEHSGTDAAAFVALAGEKACTTCFPWAPVDTLRRATRLELRTPEQIAEQEAKAAEKAARAAAKAAKAITAPDGSTLLDDMGRPINTARAAEIEFVRMHADHRSLGYSLDAACAERLLAALAHKAGVEVEAKRAELTPRIAAKIKRDRRG